MDYKPETMEAKVSFKKGDVSFTRAISCWRAYKVKSHLVIDGGPELNQQEAVGKHGENTQDGGEEDCQPNVGLAQRVPGCSWTNTNIHRVYIYTRVRII